MGEDDINVVELEVLQALQSSLDNVLPGKTSGVVGLFSVGTEEDLGGDDDVSSVPAELLDDTTHLPLGLYTSEGASRGARRNSPLRQSKPRRSAYQLLHYTRRPVAHVEHVDTFRVSV